MPAPTSPADAADSADSAAASAVSGSASTVSADRAGRTAAESVRPAGPADRTIPNPARQASIRNANLALVYRLILDAPAPLSRAALAAATGVTRATASALADALLEAGLIVEVSPPPATGAGRPAAGLVPAADGPAGLGLEINVDYLAACVVDLTGAVRATVIRHGDQRGRAVAEVLADLAGAAGEATAEAGLTVAGAALAVPGLVEAPHGRIRRAPNLVWQDVEIGAALGRALPDMPFEPVIGNEADFAALAEAHGAPGSGSVLDGAGVGGSADSTMADRPAPLTDFLYVSGEIGVGAGVILDRELFRGARGWAGEIGHVTVVPDGARCRCGARGCLETVAGLEALRRDGPEAAASALGRAAAAAVNLLDLPAVVLGGAYARPEFAALVPGVEKALTEHVVSARWAPVAVHVSRRGTAAAVTGAATAVIRRVHGDPAAWMAAC
ncbi:ROK family protein [Catenulispora rubra]|uniref:ROK family protein n=1 Tax=Catenulispora rubra TaxID=280293 RepID=UPI001E2F0DEC|nr:ROK family protein [Catenulispora rubra]